MSSIDLITSPDGEARVSSETIADHATIEHRAVLQLLTNYEDDFAEFGRVAFEMRPFGTAGGLQHRKVAHLSEYQATLLLTYLRNTEQVRGFKKALVRAFRDAKSAPVSALTEDEIVHQALDPVWPVLVVYAVWLAVAPPVREGAAALRGRS